MTNPHCPARDIAHPVPGYSYRLKPAPRRPTAGRWGHKESDMIAIAVGIVAVVAVAVLIAGLCRAAADTKEVTEDTGEYK